MTDKDPLQTLAEIHSMLTQLTAKVNLLETNVALLHDKANGHLFPDVKFKAGKASSAPGQMQVPPNASQEVINDLTGPQTIGVPLQQAAKPKAEKARVFGAVFGQNKKPLHNVSVLIKNQAQELVGDLKTNLGGEWETHLGPGKYAITYTRQGMSAIYRFVEIKPGQQEARVM